MKFLKKKIYSNSFAARLTAAQRDELFDALAGGLGLRAASERVRDWMSANAEAGLIDERAEGEMKVTQGAVISRWYRRVVAERRYERARELAGVGLAEAPEDYDDQTTRALGHARYLATLEGIGVSEIAALERNALAREKFAFEQRKFDIAGRERRCQAVLTQAQALVAEVREQGRGERFQQLIDIALEEIEKMKRGEE